jgi:hypothetical protein
MSKKSGRRDAEPATVILARCHSELGGGGASAIQALPPSRRFAGGGEMRP